MFLTASFAWYLIAGSNEKRLQISKIADDLLGILHSCPIVYVIQPHLSGPLFDIVASISIHDIQGTARSSNDPNVWNEGHWTV